MRRNFSFRKHLTMKLCWFVFLTHLIIFTYAKTCKHKNDRKHHLKHGKLHQQTLQNDDVNNWQSLRMVNGTIARKGNFPWAAALLCTKFDNVIMDLVYPGGDLSYKVQSCGASILTSKFLITAAHCFFVPAFGSPHRPFCVQYWLCEPLFRYSASHLQVVVGVVNLLELRNYPRYKVTEIYTHPDYNTQTLANDVGLIRLVDEQPIQFTQNIFGLGVWNVFVGDGLDAVIAGWGANCWENLTDHVRREHERKQVYDLKYIKVQTAKFENCNENGMNYDKTNDNSICLGAIDQNVGQGDSGGGLYFTHNNGSNYLLGVVSTITTCGYTEPGVVYSVFTRLSPFREWIYETINSKYNINQHNINQNQQNNIQNQQNNIQNQQNNNQNQQNNNQNQHNSIPQPFDLFKLIHNFTGLSIFNKNNNNHINNNNNQNNNARQPFDLGKMIQNVPGLSQNMFPNNHGLSFSTSSKRQGAVHNKISKKPQSPLNMSSKTK